MDTSTVTPDTRDSETAEQRYARAMLSIRGPLARLIVIIAATDPVDSVIDQLSGTIGDILVDLDILDPADIGRGDDV